MAVKCCFISAGWLFVCGTTYWHVCEFGFANSVCLFWHCHDEVV